MNSKKAQRKRLATNRSITDLLQHCFYITFKYYIFVDVNILNPFYRMNTGFLSREFPLYGCVHLSLIINICRDITGCNQAFTTAFVDCESQSFKFKLEGNK